MTPQDATGATQSDEQGAQVPEGQAPHERRSERETARIETLTATVRTLVVGKRQITLSIAKQLDVVPLADLDVMGRVRLTLPDRAGPFVIGCDRDGLLALAEVGRTIPADLQLTAEQVGGQMHVCHLGTRVWPDYRSWNSPRLTEVAIGDGDSVIVPGSSVRTCRGEHDGDTCPAPGIEMVTLMRLRARLAPHRKARKAEAERIKAANAAPLIVLAGLR